jgi:uncharacterized membrane protein
MFSCVVLGGGLFDVVSGGVYWWRIFSVVIIGAVVHKEKNELQHR